MGVDELLKPIGDRLRCGVKLRLARTPAQAQRRMHYDLVAPMARPRRKDQQDGCPCDRREPQRTLRHLPLPPEHVYLAGARPRWDTIDLERHDPSTA